MTDKRTPLRPLRYGQNADRSVSAVAVVALLLAAPAVVLLVGLVGYDLLVGFDRLNPVAGGALWLTLGATLLALALAAVSAIVGRRLTAVHAWALLLAFVHLALFALFMCFHVLSDSGPRGVNAPGTW